MQIVVTFLLYNKTTTLKWLDYCVAKQAPTASHTTKITSLARKSADRLLSLLLLLSAKLSLSLSLLLLILLSVELLLLLLLLNSVFKTLSFVGVQHKLFLTICVLPKTNLKLLILMLKLLITNFGLCTSRLSCELCVGSCKLEVVI